MKRELDYNELYLKRSRYYAKLFQATPFLRCLILNGSVAIGTATKNSDIDILVIAQSGRIFTVRFCLVVLAWLLRVKRPRDESADHSGKFCFNHFITNKSLLVSTNRNDSDNAYCAKSFLNSVLLWGDRSAYRAFLSSNKGWMSRYLVYRNSGDYRPEAMVPHGVITKLFRSLIELMLRGWLGNLIESLARLVQIRSIKGDSGSQKYPDLIICSNSELRFYLPKQTLR